MHPEEATTDCHHPRSLALAIRFLDEYHPASEDKLNLVHGLRDRIRNNPHPQDVLNLAKAVEGTPFVLRRGVVRHLPGLARKIRNSAGTIEPAEATTQSTSKRVPPGREPHPQGRRQGRIASAN